MRQAGGDRQRFSSRGCFSRCARSSYFSSAKLGPCSSSGSWFLPVLRPIFSLKSPERGTRRKRGGFAPAQYRRGEPVTALMAGRGMILSGAATRSPLFLAGGPREFQRRVHAPAQRSGPIEHDAAIATLGNNDGRPILALKRSDGHRPMADGTADRGPVVHAARLPPAPAAKARGPARGLARRPESTAMTNPRRTTDSRWRSSSRESMERRFISATSRVGVEAESGEVES
jgi:hypothetical protein